MHDLGLYVIGTDINDPNTVVNSKFTDAFYKSPRATDTEYLPFVIDLIKKENAEYILPLTDPEIDILSPNRDNIVSAGDFGFMVGEYLKKHGAKDFVYLADDKYLTTDKFYDYRLLPTSIGFSGEYNVVFAIGKFERLKNFLAGNILDKIYYVFDPYEFCNIDQKYLEIHAKEYQETLDIYADDLSRETLKAYLKAKTMGVIDDEFKIVDESRMYFNDLTKNVSDGAYIDVGVFDGTQINEFLDFVKDDKRKIFGFEPEPVSFAKISAKYEGRENIKLIEFGAYKEEGELYFSHKGHDDRELTLLTAVEDKTDSVKVTTINKIAKDEKVSFIKITIGGGEFFALQGADEILRRDHPIVACSCFGRNNEFFDIPKFLHNVGGYNIYLRHHMLVSGHLCIYAF